METEGGGFQQLRPFPLADRRRKTRLVITRTGLFLFPHLSHSVFLLFLCLTLYIYGRFCARLANSRCAAASVQDVSSQGSRWLCRPLSLALFLFPHASISFSHIFNNLSFFLMFSTLAWSLPSLFRIDRLAIISDIHHGFCSFFWL